MRAPACISPPNRSDRSASVSVTERGKRPVLEKIGWKTGGKPGAGVDTLFRRRCWPLVRLGTLQWSVRLPLSDRVLLAVP